MSTFTVEGMKCQSCVAKIGEALAKAGRRDAQVTLDPPTVNLHGPAMSAEELQKIVSRAGPYQLRTAGTQPDPAATTLPPPEGASEERLTPLFAILAYIIGGVFLRAAIAGDFEAMTLMNNFMGGFFTVFSLFKLLNLAGFAEAYATYDLLAARSRAYALAYPFIELLLGVAYFTNFAPIPINGITLLLMSVGAVGVFRALRTKRKFQCACLGTALKLPMTKVTLVEDVTMGIMALLMIIMNAGV